MDSSELFKSTDYPVSVRYNREPPDSHYHREIEFSLVLRGHGQYFVRDRIYDLQPGNGLIIHANEVHYGIAEQNTDMLRAVLMFDTQLIADRPSAADALHKISSHNFFDLIPTQSISAELLLREIGEEIRTKPAHWQQLIACNLERFLLYVSRATEDESRTQTPTPNPTMLLILDYLQTAYRHSTAIEDICRHFAMSSSSLRRLFKKYTGLAPKEFIILMRISRSKHLLRHTDTKISAIAFDVGFDNLSAFNRYFRISTGMSPSEYRKIVRG